MTEVDWEQRLVGALQNSGISYMANYGVQPVLS
jgi:hypothetical protein